MPAAPSSVFITTGDGVINVGWEASIDEVTSYTLYYKVTTASDMSPENMTPAPPTATSATILGLINGTAYSVWVTATSADLTESAPSHITDNVIPLGAPSQPGLACARGPAAGQLTFTITPPSDYGDNANTTTLTYRLYKDAGALPMITDISETILVVGPSNLTIGESASFTVVATNGPGVSIPSDVVTNTPIGPPGAPTVDADLNNGVTLNITPPVNRGGDSYVTYNIWSVNIRDSTLNTQIATGISDTIYIIPELTANIVNYISVSASNSMYTSSLSAPVSSRALTKPGTPSLTVTAGDAIVYITVLYTDNGAGDLFTDLSFNIYENGALIRSQSNNPVYSIQDASNGETYSYTATIANELFTSDMSLPQIATPLETPRKPQNLVLDPSDSSVQITFDRPISTDLSVLLTYNIYRNDEVIASGPETLFIDNGLTNGQPYTYRVTALNINNTEGDSETGASTPFGIPQPPVIAADPVNGIITLTLIRPIIDGGSNNLEFPVSLQYAIYRTDSSTAIVTGLTSDTYEVNPAIITVGTPYSFKATVSNNVFTSDFSNITTPITVYSKPGPPTVRIKALDGSIKLNISPSINMGGDTSVTYTVTRGDDIIPLNNPTGIYEYVDTSLENGIVYTYVVTASNSSSTSDAVIVNAKPMATPEAPVVEYEFVSSQITLTITPPTNNYGVVSYSYTIYNGIEVIRLIPAASPTEKTVVTIPTVDGEIYNISVSASTMILEGQSSPTRSITTYGIPGAAGMLAYGHDGFVTLTVSPPINTGGGPIYYTITRAEGETLSNLYLVTSNDTATEYTDTNVVNGTLYYYAVSASNSVFYSIFSTDAAAIPLSPPVFDVFEAVIDPIISQRVNLILTLTDCGNGTPTGTNLRYEFKRGTTVVTAENLYGSVWALDGEPVGRSVSYTVTVMNQNDVSVSATSNAVTPVIYAVVNGEIATVAVVNTATFDVGTVATGTPVAINSGTVEVPVYVTAITTDITGEDYNSSDANALLVDAMDLAIESGINSILVKRIFPGDETATNSLIELGTPAAPLTSATAGGTKSTTLDLPAATYGDGTSLPADKTVVACDITPRTDGQPGSYILIKVQVDGVTLTDGFSIPITIKDNSAPGLTGYPLFHFVDGAWKLLVILPPNPTDPSGCTYTGILTENQDYAGGVQPLNVPDAPAKPTTVAQVGAITVNYSAPASIISPITNYRIYWSANSGAITGNAYVGSTATSFSVPNLLANTSYTFVVAAINENGEGPDSPPSDPIQTTPPPPPPICFLANAPVLTPRGYRRIDSLKVGDLVRLADGRSMAIKAVKVVRYAPSVVVNPFVIPKGTFGAKERLLISPSHRIAVPGRGMVKACDLGLKQWKMNEAFEYYNLELEKWDNMVVAGVEVESLAPIRRAIVTKEQFRQILVAKYGALASDPNVLSRIFKTCHDIGNGLINMPCFK
jgi:hypothetical protein